MQVVGVRPLLLDPCLTRGIVELVDLQPAQEFEDRSFSFLICNQGQLQKRRGAMSRPQLDPAPSAHRWREPARLLKERHGGLGRNTAPRADARALCRGEGAPPAAPSSSPATPASGPSTAARYARPRRRR